MICMFKVMHYCQMIHLRTLEMCMKINELDPPKFLSAAALACHTALQKTKVKLNFLTDIYRLLMIEKVIRGGICHSIY